MSFSESRSLRRSAPPRVLRECAPEDLRLTLRKIMLDKRGALVTYRSLSEALHRFPNSNIWSDQFAHQEIQSLIEELEWYEVFDLLENEADGPSEHNEVNSCFERCGLAYEMVGRKIVDYDPEGHGFETDELEGDPIPVLVGKFEAVKEQYLRALSALRGRPSDEEKAISEALGALEGVARVLSGKSEFGPSLNAIFATQPEWAKALSASLKALYGYGSQVPGARHGRYADPEIAHSEARFVVRVCALAICYLIDGERTNRWPDLA